MEEAYDADMQTWLTKMAVFGPDHLETLISASNLSIELTMLGRSQEALELDLTVYEQKASRFGAEAPTTLLSLNSLVVDLIDLGHSTEALGHARTSYQAHLRVFGDGSPHTLRTAANLAIALKNVGELSEACHLGEQTMARLRHSLGPDHPDTLQFGTEFVSILFGIGAEESAVCLAQDIYDGSFARFGLHTPFTLNVLSMLVTLHVRQGRRSWALPLYELLHRARRETLGEAHPYTLVVAVRRAAILDEGSARSRERARQLRRSVVVRYRPESWPWIPDHAMIQDEIDRGLRR
ncbi:tetratricopeptide repeat protein [Frankia gtarii]|uniref:tetratricopeptide repeat protein n=1 Tax=Frankia gtarii TaxID=2950102 RepID=UPI0021BF4B99|nr:tetratricopeptide repeat protein [Frankia gtarii]